MNTITVSQYARPLRIAFLVNKLTYLDAAKINTAIWGGMLNPLVPVQVSYKAADKKRVLDLLTDFDVDLVVNTTKYKYPYIEKAYPNNPIKKRYINLSELTGQAYNSKRLEIKYGTSLLPVLRDVWNDTRFLQGNSNSALLENKNHPDWEEYITFVFGRYPTKNPFDFSKDYKNVLKPKELDFEPAEIEKNDLFNRGYPLELTLHDLEDFGGGFSSMDSHTVYLGQHDNWEDLIEYWNLRAIGVNTIFLPITKYKELKKTVSDHIDAGTYQINPQVQSHVTLMSSQNIMREDAEEVARWITADLKKTNVALRAFPVTWNRKHKIITPDVNRREWRTAEKEEVITFDEHGFTPFYLTSPDFLNRSRGFKEMAFISVIEFSGYYGTDYCFSFPNDPEVEDVLAGSLTARGELRLSPEGINLTRKYNSERVFGRPVETQRVVEALFKSAGFSVEPSQPGRIARNLIRFLDGIEGCRLLKVDGIRRSLRELNNKGSMNADALVNFIGTHWHKEDNDDLILLAGQPRPLTAPIALDALVNAKLVRPGLKLKCPQCGQSEWYSVSEINEQYKCKACLELQEVPRLDGLKWSYATNGLVSIRDEGYGSIPVILSLWRFNHLQSIRSAQPMTSILVKSQKLNQEIDYLHLVTENNGTYELVIGEAKGLNEIKADDVKKMERIAEQFDNPPYIAFTTLKDELNPQEKGRIKRLINKGYRVIVLTRLELEPYDTFDRFENAPHKYAVSLSDLAENTQQLNLN
jgi:hypothetical protein